MNLKLPQEQVLKRVYEAMEYMNLKTFENRATHTLSGGEKKKSNYCRHHINAAMNLPQH